MLNFIDLTDYHMVKNYQLNLLNFDIKIDWENFEDS